jgi:hypothetical protein
MNKRARLFPRPTIYFQDFIDIFSLFMRMILHRLIDHAVNLPKANALF